MNNPIKKHQSLIYALSIFVLLSAWLASGYLGSDNKTSAEENATAARSLTQKVRVRVPRTQRVIEEIVLNGRTEIARAVTLRSEVEARVVALAATQGAAVSKGDIIVQLDARDRQARLTEAHALLKQHELEYAGIKKLQKNNLLSEIQLAKIASQLAAARAQVKRIELEILNTRMKAPFDGILDRLLVEVGSYLNIGDEVGRLLEQDPILFVGYVSQQDRHRLVLGDKGIIRFVTGLVAEGELRYIAAEADPVTRVFKVEVQIPNPDRSLVSGITAEIRIPVRFVSAYQISHALLSLNNSDQLGIKIVNAENRVEFLPIEVVKSTAAGLWISGLPKDIRIITVGQGFVRAGDEVIAVDEQEIIDKSTAN
jgi:multidrug efflux system membrane fusion protein